MFGQGGDEGDLVGVGGFVVGDEALQAIEGAVADVDGGGDEGVGVLEGTADAVGAAEAWAAEQARVKEVREVRFAAVDEGAREAYWVRVEEWGSEAGAARVRAVVGEDGTVAMELKNVGVVGVDRGERTYPGLASRLGRVGVRVHGVKVGEVEAGAKKFFVMADGKGGWTVSEPERAAFRLHFGNGPGALYRGEPLLVVWGTRGDEATNKALREIGEVARAATEPMEWPSALADERGFVGRALYGRLAGKADVEVTEEDMRRCNLVLIGTAKENAVVARMAEQLPVRIEGGKVAASDGARWDWRDGRGLSVVYYNPLSPQRLIHWVAGENGGFYQANGGPLRGFRFWSAVVADVAVVGATGNERVACRYFDSRWRWSGGEAYRASGVLGEDDVTVGAMARVWAEAVRRAGVADYGIGVLNGEPGERLWSAGETRVADVVTESADTAGVMEVRGEELLAWWEKSREKGSWFVIVPAVEEGRIEKDKMYRVAMPAWGMWSFAEATHNNPESLRMVEAPVREAMRGVMEGGTRE